MKSQSKIRRTTLAITGAAVAAAALVPAAAQAQQYGYGYDQGGYYGGDACRSDRNGRTVVGAIVGGLAGMALGNNIGDDRRYNRRGYVVGDNDTNATVGALLGAGLGGAIGRNSGPCAPDPRYATDNRAYSYTPDYGYGYSQPYYDDRYAPPPRAYAPPPAYDYGYQDEGYYGGGYYDGRGACRMVESRIRMPDGRTQTRMVQACPDSQGRYQIVD